MAALPPRAPKSRQPLPIPPSSPPSKLQLSTPQVHAKSAEPMIPRAMSTSSTAQPQPQPQPCHSSYINLKKMGTSSARGGGSPDPVAVGTWNGRAAGRARCPVVVAGCKHFPEVEVEAGAGARGQGGAWACEFCDGAKLIEQASRSNEAVSSLDLDKLLHGTYYNMGCRETSMGESNNRARNAANSSYNKMGTWILRTRGRDSPGNY